MHKLVVFTLLLFCLKCLESADLNCDDGEEATCGTCFRKLVNETITPDGNQYRMQEAFFPPDKANPIYVTVNYAFQDENGTFQNVTWYWSASTYYSSIQPLSVFQYTSLFFGDLSTRTQQLFLVLEMECYNSAVNNTGFMMLLTQRVCIHVSWWT